jgi:hypothetical protein
MESIRAHSTPDICFLNARVGYDRLRGAVADHPTIVEHDQSLAAPQHFLEIMLDQNYGYALCMNGCDSLYLPCSLGLIQTGQRFIEENDVRIKRERAGDFKPFHLTERQRAGELPFGAGKSDADEEGRGAFVLRPPFNVQRCAQRV